MIGDKNNLGMTYWKHIHDNSMYGQVKFWSRQAEDHHLSRC